MPRPRSVSDEVILASTGVVLARHGPARFTLNHLAEEVGLSAATLLQRFGSKRGLLVAYSKSAALHAKEPFETARRQLADAPPLDQLRRAFASSSRELKGRHEMANRLSLLIDGLDDDELRAAVARRAEIQEREIEKLLEEAIARGELEGDPRKLAHTVHAAWTGALIHWAIRGDTPFEIWLERALAPILGN